MSTKSQKVVLYLAVYLVMVGGLVLAVADILGRGWWEILGNVWIAVGFGGFIVLREINKGG